MTKNWLLLIQNQNLIRKTKSRKRLLRIKELKWERLQFLTLRNPRQQTSVTPFTAWVITALEC